MADTGSTPVSPALLEQRVRAFQVDGHRRGAQVSAVASLAGAGVSLLWLWPGVPLARALPWLAALLAVQAWRGVLLRPTAPPDEARLLRQLRWVTLTHGVVWAGLVLLPPWPWSPETAKALAVAVAAAGLTGTAMALMYDAPAALRFAAAPALTLAVVVQQQAGSVPGGVLLALVVLVVTTAVLAGMARRLRGSLHGLAADLALHAEAGRRSAEGETLLRRVFDHLADGVSMFDADGRLVAWNARMAELVGLRHEQLAAGMPLRGMLVSLAEQGLLGDADPAGEVERRLAAIRGPAPAWGRLKRPGGRTVEVRSNPMPDGGFTLLAVDITERRAAAHALAENRAMLELLLRNTEEGVWTIDNELRTLDANAAMCRMLGVTREQMLGRTIYDFVDSTNDRIFRDQVRRRDEGLPGSYEIALRRADGTLVHTQNNPTPLFDAQGRKVGAVGLFSDITAIHNAAAELERTSHQLEAQTRVLGATLDSLDQGVMAVDREGRVEAFNERAVQLLQTPPDVLHIGAHLRDVVAWQLQAGYFDDAGSEPVQRSRQAVQRYVDGDDNAASSGHYWRQRPDGQVIEVKVHRSAGGGEVRTYADVTARVRADRALVNARDEAERANRAKSEFLSHMSHELRTPLNAVLGFAQLLERDHDVLAPQQRQDHVQQILRGARHLQVLINDVLDLARIESGSLPVQIEPVAVAPLVEICGGLMEPMARERRVHVHLRPPPQPGLVLADATRLQQVLINLLSNAIKYNHEGGDVVLSFAGRPGRLRIEVGDTGPGLSDEQQSRLFQAFERLGADRSAVEGAGIGLALCKSLLDLMNGAIGVRSQPGQGSTFWIELPLADAAATVPRAVPPVLSAHAPPRADGRPWRVLYIEDNAVNQILVQSMLARLKGMELAIASTPDDGLAQLRQSAFDLLLLDIQLPGIDGYEVLRRVRADAATATLPVVAVSANAMAADLQRAREAGFDRYLTKPLDLPELLLVVCGLLEASEAAATPA